jgi:hypothetical protein
MVGLILAHSKWICTRSKHGPFARLGWRHTWFFAKHITTFKLLARVCDVRKVLLLRRESTSGKLSVKSVVSGTLGTHRSVRVRRSLMARMHRHKRCQIATFHSFAFDTSSTSSGGGRITPLESNVFSVGSRIASEPLGDQDINPTGSLTDYHMSYSQNGPYHLR